MPDDQTTIPPSIDFPPVGTVWRWFNFQRPPRMAEWEVLGYIHGQLGAEVISRLVSDKQTIASHPLELLTFKFSNEWRPGEDIEGHVQEFADAFPQYDFVLSTLGWVQLPEGYIAFTPDKVIWGLGDTAAAALKNGDQHLRDNDLYAGNESLKATRATIDVNAYVHDHSGAAVPWTIVDGIAWLTADIEGSALVESKQIAMTSDNQTVYVSPKDFPPIGTVWMGPNYNYDMDTWTIVGWHQARLGKQVLCRPSAAPERVALFPVELIYFTFSENWHDNIDPCERMSEFWNLYPQYEDWSDIGAIQGQSGFIAYTNDKIIWGVGNTKEEALQNAEEELSYDKEYRGDRALTVIRSSGDVEGYVEDNGGGDVPWFIQESTAWLLDDIEGTTMMEKNSLKHDQ